MLIDSTVGEVVPIGIVWNCIYDTEVGVGNMIKRYSLACSSFKCQAGEINFTILSIYSISAHWIMYSQIFHSNHHYQLTRLFDPICYKVCLVDKSLDKMGGISCAFGFTALNPDVNTVVVVDTPTILTDPTDVEEVCMPYNVAYKLLFTQDFSSSLIFLVFSFPTSRTGTWPWEKITTLTTRRTLLYWYHNMCTNGGYQLCDGMPTLDFYSSYCCNTLFVYSVKADLQSKEMLVLTQSLSSVLLEGINMWHVSVIGIAETEVDLPTDLPYFKLNCSSKVSGSTCTYPDVGWEIFSREPCIVLSLSVTIVDEHTYLYPSINNILGVPRGRICGGVGVVHGELSGKEIVSCNSSAWSISFLFTYWPSSVSISSVDVDGHLYLCRLLILLYL